MTPRTEPAPHSDCTLRRVLGPALLTLAVTMLRLILEGMKAPDWLANREAGGRGALIGITWLPLIFGPWFVAQLRTGVESTWTLVKRLLKTLVVYGWASRVPVVIVVMLGLAFGWDTHFNKFGPTLDQSAVWVRILVTLGAQFVFWSIVWTPIVGGIAGLVFHLLTRGRAASTPRAAGEGMTLELQ